MSTDCLTSPFECEDCGVDSGSPCINPPNADVGTSIGGGGASFSSFVATVACGEDDICLELALEGSGNSSSEFTSADDTRTGTAPPSTSSLPAGPGSRDPESFLRLSPKNTSFVLSGDAPTGFLHPSLSLGSSSSAFLHPPLSVDVPVPLGLIWPSCSCSC